MATEIVIRVLGERAGDIHRNRNMAEDLQRELLHRGCGTTSDPDTMTTEFRVWVRARRDLGDTAALVRAIVARHRMGDNVAIERGRP